MPKYVTIKRHFAVMLEDAIMAPLPDDIDPTNKDTLNEWAFDNYDRLYGAVKELGESESGVTLLWEDEHKLDLDFPEAEITAEVN